MVRFHQVPVISPHCVAVVMLLMLFTVYILLMVWPRYSPFCIVFDTNICEMRKDETQVARLPIRPDLFIKKTEVL